MPRETDLISLKGPRDPINYIFVFDSISFRIDDLEVKCNSMEIVTDIHGTRVAPAFNVIYWGTCSMRVAHYYWKCSNAILV